MEVGVKKQGTERLLCPEAPHGPGQFQFDMFSSAIWSQYPVLFQT